MCLCSQFDKALSQNNNLITHLITHTGKRTYQFMHFNKAFIVNDSHKNVYLYTEKKPYQCSKYIYDKAFSVKSILKHIREYTNCIDIVSL